MMSIPGILYTLSLLLCVNSALSQLTSGKSYRLSSMMQGACRSLSEPSPSSVEPQMAKTDHVPNQIWTFTKHPTKAGLYKITAPSGRVLKMEPGFNPDLDDPTSNGSLPLSWRRLDQAANMTESEVESFNSSLVSRTRLKIEPNVEEDRDNLLKLKPDLNPDKDDSVSNETQQRPMPSTKYNAKGNPGLSTSPNNYAAAKLILTTSDNNLTETDENLFYWSLEATDDNGGHYRLVNARVTLQDTDKCLGVREETSSEVEALEDVAYEGSVWMITPGEKVSGVPASLGLDPFYRKYVSMEGVPIISSQNVPDDALYRAYFIVRHLVSKSKPLRQAMVRQRAKLAVIGQHELTTSIPEHRFLGPSWNTRARGLGGTVSIPTASCAEENLLCYPYPDDRWTGQDITVHEFAHSVHNLGLHFADPNFEATLYQLYNSAIAAGKYEHTYAGTNAIEYFATGVQSWFNVNAEAIPPNGINNYVNTRSELKEYDPGLHDLLAKWMPHDYNKCSCH